MKDVLGWFRNDEILRSSNIFHFLDECSGFGNIFSRYQDNPMV